MEETVPTAATETSMKVLQCAGIRLALRLEHIFWLQLDELALQAGTGLNKYVHRVLGNAGDDANRASVLRCHCLKAARDDKVAASLLAGDIKLTLLLTACPSPAFILKDERTIVAHNPAFAARFLRRRGDGAEDRKYYVRISYTRPFNKLREFLEQNPNKALNTLLVLSTGHEDFNCRARLMLVGPQDKPFIMAFFEDGNSLAKQTRKAPQTALVSL
ncbi:MAG: ribbon-helix-helix domain-containing protein [Anderseniella sp.]